MEFSTVTWVVMFGVWCVLGLLLSIWANSLWKGYRPFGEMVDHIVSIVLAILTGIADMLVMPALIEVDKIVVFIAAIVEPAGVVLLALWLLRKIKPQQEV